MLSCGLIWGIISNHGAKTNQFIVFATKWTVKNVNGIFILRLPKVALYGL